MLSWEYGEKPKIQTTMSTIAFTLTRGHLHSFTWPIHSTTAALQCFTVRTTAAAQASPWAVCSQCLGFVCSSSSKQEAHCLRLPRGCHWDVWVGVLPVMTCMALHWLDREPGDRHLFIILLWIHQICFEVRHFVLPFCPCLQVLLAVSERLLYPPFENSYHVW